MNLKSIGMAATITLFSSSFTLAIQGDDSNVIYVQASSYLGPQSSKDQQLVRELIEQLQSDSKLSGHLELSSRNGNISISGRVNEVTMIYRAVEIIKRNSSVKHVDARELDT